MKTIIIQGSSRNNGNTRRIADLISKELHADQVDLCNKTIHPYSYDHVYREDDFFPLFRKVVSYDLILLLTPVYWYAMSGLMKNFLDRITDCLKVEKETGRKLRGKALAAVSCGSDPTEVEGFFIPFALSADYLGMEYLGDLHTYIGDGELNKEVLKKIERFTNNLKRGSI